MTTQARITAAPDDPWARLVDRVFGNAAGIQEHGHRLAREIDRHGHVVEARGAELKGSSQ